MNLGGSIRVNKCAVFCCIALFVLLIYILSSSVHSLQKFQKSQQKVNLRKLVIGLIIAASSGGQEVIKVSSEPDFLTKSKGLTKEGVEDYVTQADLYSHCTIAHGLWKLFPSLNLISEEDAQAIKCPNKGASFDLDPSVLSTVELPYEVNVASEDLTVWIDPLDATKEFTEKLFHYVSVMICVAVKGEPVIGIVHFPFNKKTYWAWKDHGVSENLANIKADHDTVKSPIVIVSRSHAGEVQDLAKKMFGEVGVIHAAGSGYKIIQVLEGNATIYLHNTRIKKWDLCAGNAIVSSVGGTMKTLKGHEISYTADSNPVVEDGLLVELNKNVILNV